MVEKFAFLMKKAKNAGNEERAKSVLWLFSKEIRREKEEEKCQKWKKEDEKRLSMF